MAGRFSICGGGENRTPVQRKTVCAILRGVDHSEGLSDASIRLIRNSQSRVLILEMRGRASQCLSEVTSIEPYSGVGFMGGRLGSKA